MSVSDISSILTVVISGLNLSVLAVTLYWLWRYTKDTEQIKNEYITQTQLQQKPILAVYIQLDDDKKLKDYRLVEDQLYIIRVRNVGHGAAANLKAIVQKGDRRFEVTYYQQNFLEPEPKGDEQAIKLAGVNDISDLNGATVIASCQDFSERWTSPSKPYEFKYEIEDIEKMRVKYIEDEK